MIILSHWILLSLKLVLLGKKKSQFELSFLFVESKTHERRMETAWRKLRPFLPTKHTDLDSLPLLGGERFSRLAPLFWGEEVVKEFPESEVLPLFSSWPLLRPALGLPFSWP